MLAEAAAARLTGTRIAAADIEEASQQAMQEVEPYGSVHASADYQRHLAGVLTRRALKVARDRAKGTA